MPRARPVKAASPDPPRMRTQENFQDAGAHHRGSSRPSRSRAGPAAQKHPQNLQVPAVPPKQFHKNYGSLYGLMPNCLPCAAFPAAFRTAVKRGIHMASSRGMASHGHVRPPGEPSMQPWNCPPGECVSGGSARPAFCMVGFLYGRPPCMFTEIPCGDSLGIPWGASGFHAGVL